MTIENLSSPLSRKEFIEQSALVATSGLMLKFCLESGRSVAAPGKTFSPNVFLLISKEEGVVFYCHRSEMGQGVRTSMTMLIAEELEMDLDRIKVEQAPGHPKYGDQNTDGSTSVRKNFTPLRKAAATARTMLIKAASKQWKAPEKSIVAKDGYIINTSGSQKARYEDLATIAARLRIPNNVKLKARSEFKQIGTSPTRTDMDAIISGKAQYGIDVSLPNMVYASVERAPFRDGRIVKLDDSKALKEPGVVSIVEIDAVGSGVLAKAGVAVIASSYFAATKARQLLQIQWSQPKSSKTDFQAQLKTSLSQKKNKVAQFGNIATAMKNSDFTLRQEYTTPFLSHAQMEPVCATAVVKGDQCEVWAPTQDPQRARKMVATKLGFKESNVTINVTMLGGGFGRKSQPDFIVEACAIAKKIKLPVKVLWSREDDMQHGYYHAAARQELEVGLKKNGQLTALEHHVAFPSNKTIWNPSHPSPASWEMGMGATNSPYFSNAYSCKTGNCVTPVKIGWLRSVCNIQHSFALNSILDEASTATNQDPIKHRLELLKKRAGQKAPIGSGGGFSYPRMRRVIEKVSSASTWGHTDKQKVAKGFAVHYSFLSYVAMVVELSGELSQGSLNIERVYAAVDCGVAIHPDHIKAQIEGSVVFGLSLALYGKIDQDQGRILQSNFHDYPILRNNEMPEVHVEMIDNGESPTGLGEPGVPPVAPALTNAIYQLTGKRVRDLPIFG